MKKVTCVVADDEVLAREVITNYIDKVDNLTLVSTCANGIEVFTALKTCQVDLLFLDIQMPILNGISLLKSVSNPPAVILTTAYRDFALESYELDVTDYLLKPISFDRFIKAVDKYLRNTGVEVSPLIPATPPSLKGNDIDFIYIKSEKKMIRVTLKDITYLEGLKDYVKVHTTTASIITYQTLSYFNEKLPSHLFIRVHRSFIVAVNQITALTAARIEIGKIDIPIGSSFSTEVAKKLI
ncbi:LytR/AlgR family response regulator transcription factor [Mucilaginibacter sp.]|uniref:LytR/AlgR family response regulator transcription factor n=1 Tax=Mucilaginibacter sp. TaxID=1882438 RepID=UPI0035BBB709